MSSLDSRDSNRSSLELELADFGILSRTPSEASDVSEAEQRLFDEFTATVMPGFAPSAASMRPSETDSREVGQTGWGAGGFVAAFELEEASRSAPPVARVRSWNCSGAVGIFAAMLLLLFLFVFCFAGIEATQYGLRRNALTGVVDYSSVYLGGRYFIGPHNNFVMFPSTIRTVAWSHGNPAVSSTRHEPPIRVRTHSGIMVDLSLAVQYQIVRDTVPQMYADYKLAVEQNVVSMLRSGISDLVQDHPTSDFWTQRERMQRLFLEKCRRVCASPLSGMKGYVTCWNLQLHRVNIPGNVENAVIRQQVQHQNARVEHNRQVASITRARTAVRMAEIDRDIGMVQASARASAFAITQSELSAQLSAWRQARARAITVTKEELPALSSDQLIRFFELKAIIDSDSSSLAYGNISVIRT